MQQGKLDATKEEIKKEDKQMLYLIEQLKQVKNSFYSIESQVDKQKQELTFCCKQVNHLKKNI